MSLIQCTAFELLRDLSGQNSYGLVQSTLKYSSTLAANVLQSQVVPGNFSRGVALFTYDPGAAVWVAINDGDAEIPGASFALTNSELNPTLREVYPGQSISFITDDTFAKVSVVFYGYS